MYDRFNDAVASAEPTFSARISKVLDEVVKLNSEDPSLANFLVSARSDVGRHHELADDKRLGPIRRGAFFGSLVDLGIETGEIRIEDRQTALDVITAIMMGLVSASSRDPDTHARAVAGIKTLLSGELFSDAATLDG
ncbi:MAG: hypothetical protein ACR2PK_18120 [Acidimicrobiales bacterium]